MKSGKVKKGIVLVLMTALVMSSFTFLTGSSSTYASGIGTATGKVKASSGAYLRKSPTTSSAQVKILKNGSKVVIKNEVFKSTTDASKTKRWLYVESDGSKGYIRADLVTGIKYPAVQGKTTDSVNYRKGAGAEMVRKGTFGKGKAVTVVGTATAQGTNATWYKIKVDSKYYYMHSAYVKLGTSTSSESSSSKSAKTTAATTAANTDPPGDPEFTVSGTTVPTVVGEGSSFSLKGTIKSTHTISKVVIGIKDSSKAWKIRVEPEVNSTSFKISSVDSRIKFGTLKPGEYTYVCSVYVKNKEYKQFSYPFTVKKLEWPDKLAKTAIKLAWAQGTSSSKYKYKGGKPTSAFKTALNKSYPDRSGWGKAPKVGASCDVFIGTVCRASGYDPEMPRGLGDSKSGQWAHLEQSDKWTRVPYNYKEEDLQNGDIIIYKRKSGSQHICMYVKINGKGYLAEAAIKTYYGHIGKLSTKVFNPKDKKKLYVYRASN